ncbi:MAG: nuclear transport factor 2 family protein [Novosphingobium sp.]
MKPIALIFLVALTASPGLAIANPEHHPAAASAPAEHPQAAAVRAVLLSYRTAIERLDASGTETLFAADSAIFETGGSEGTYANYLAHHLGPELAEFKSFTFSDYKVDVRFEGSLALTTETYSYRIETKDGTIAQRIGVTTSVLKQIDGQWRILVSHNSGRKPKGT